MSSNEEHPMTLPLDKYISKCSARTSAVSSSLWRMTPISFINLDGSTRNGESYLLKIYIVLHASLIATRQCDYRLGLAQPGQVYNVQARFGTGNRYRYVSVGLGAEEQHDM